MVLNGKPLPNHRLHFAPRSCRRAGPPTSSVAPTPRARAAPAPHGGTTPPPQQVLQLLSPVQHVLGQAPEVAAPTTSGSRRCPACPPCHLPLRPCALWCLNSAGLCEQQIEIIGSMLQGAVAGLGMPFGEDPQGGPPFLRAIFAQHPATGRPFGASCAG